MAIRLSRNAADTWQYTFVKKPYECGNQVPGRRGTAFRARFISCPSKTSEPVGAGLVPARFRVPLGAWQPIPFELG